MHSETEILIRLLMVEMSIKKRSRQERLLRNVHEQQSNAHGAHEQEIESAVSVLQKQQEHLDRTATHNVPVMYAGTTHGVSSSRAVMQQLHYSPSYRKPIPSYHARWKAERRDTTKLIPGKTMELRKMPAGLYGYTFLGQNYMAINQDLTHDFKYEVIVHESIHTPDEYETRVITWWMLDEEAADFHLLEQRPMRMKY